MVLKKECYFRLTALALGMMLLASTAGAEAKKQQAQQKAATVNGTAISKEEFDTEAFSLQRSFLALGRPLTCEQLKAVNKEAVESLIRREIIHQESRRAGVKADKKDIEKEIDAIKKTFLNDVEYQNELRRRNLTEEQLRSQVERNLLVGGYIEREFLQKNKPTDEETMNYYVNNVHLLKQPQQAKVSHILISSNPDWDATRRQEARRKAEKVHKELKSGREFSAMARELSDGPTRTAGGELGYVKKGQMEKQFEDVVFSLKVREISRIVETDYGFHIFKVTDVKPENIVSYDSVKEQIAKLLQLEKAKKEADLHARKLREKAQVEIFVQ